MLVSIGRRRPPTDILDTILGCHARIRAHVGIAKRLAESSAPEREAVVEAAGRVFRYFSEALPIHTLDEDLNLLPRLLGRSSNLDQVLAQMQRQHREHEALVADLLSICNVLRTDPSRLSQLQDHLAGVAERLSEAFEEHLTLEERVVFPAARGLLTVAEKALLAEEVRRRHRNSESTRNAATA
jgi:iron-sulfur cluster repair protein YtfE (RIC family)